MGCCANEPASYRNVQTKENTQPPPKPRQNVTVTAPASAPAPSVKNPENVARRQQKNNDKQGQQELKKILDQYFDKYDINDDGVLNKFELTHMVRDLYANIDDQTFITKKQIKAIQKSKDTDDDHLVTREEFYGFFKKT